MWSRDVLKTNAKKAIGGRKFWTGFLVVVIVTLLPTLLDGLFWAGNYSEKIIYYFVYQIPFADTGMFCMLSLAIVLVGILITLPLEVGRSAYFIRNRFGESRLSNVFLGFQGNYGNVVKTTFVTDLIVGLWTLLLVVPGIIKRIQYSMVPYLLSDNPNLSSSRARQISRLMTTGEKGAIFVLQLSFIGWFLIPVLAANLLDSGSFSMGVISQVVSFLGLTLIYPYYYATYSELYIFLRDRAIQTGMVEPEELGLSLAAHE